MIVFIYRMILQFWSFSFAISQKFKDFLGLYLFNRCGKLQYSQRGTFINPLTPGVRIIHARSNTAAEHPLTLVVMTLAFRDDRTRGYAVVAREGSSRSTVFHRLHNVHVNCIKQAINHQGPPCSAIGIRGVRTPRCAVFTPLAIERRWPPEISTKTTDRGAHFQRTR